MATVAVDRGRLDEALALNERVLRLRQESLPPNHPEIASSLTLQALILRKQDRALQAMPLLQRSLEIYRSGVVMELDHPAVAATLAVLGDVLLAVGRTADGVSKLNEALAMREKGVCERACVRADVFRHMVRLSRTSLHVQCWAPVTQRRSRSEDTSAT
jgi:tetratricopeptide (TPR) repeat protein